MSDSPERREEELRQHKAHLNRAIFARESKAAAQSYAAILVLEPTFMLRPPVQFDLARLLELGGELELALKAFRSFCGTFRDDENYASALLQAGHVAFRTKDFDEAFDYLRRFMEGSPPPKERLDAENLLERIPAAPHRPTFRKPRSSSVEVPRPIVFEWSVPRGSSDSVKKLAVGARNPNPTTETSKIDLKLESDISAPPVQRPAPDPKPTKDSQTFVSLPAEFAAPPPPLPTKPKLGTEDFESPPAPLPHRVRSADQARRPAVDPFGHRPPPKAKDPEPPPTPQREAERPTASKEVPKIEPPAPVPVPRTPPQHLVSKPPIGRPISTDANYLPDDSRPPYDLAAESPERRYLRLRGSMFALLLPIGKRIHLDAVAELYARHEEVDEATAKKQVIGRKGIIFDHLSLHDVVGLYPLVKECRQQLNFVHVDRTIRPYEPQPVLGAELLPPGLKLNTERGLKKVRWNEIRLTSVGTLDGKTTVDIFAGVPMKQFRLQSGTFNFATITEAARRDPVPGIMALLDVIAENAPDAPRAHTGELLRSGKAPAPQAFSSEAEFLDYNNWQIYSHYAEVVDAEELAEQNRITSNW